MPYNVSGLTSVIERVSQERPELFGKQTTQPLEERQYRDWSDAEKRSAWSAQKSKYFDLKFGEGGPSSLERGRAGGKFTPNNDLQRLEVFGFNEQQDMLTGRPQERILEGLANRVGAGERAAEARARAAKGAAIDEGTFERQTRGRGMSKRQMRSAKRALGLNRALAVANAGSSSRRLSTDLAIGARQAAVNAENTVFGQQLSGLSALANAEGQKRIREAQERAQKKSNKRGLLGTIVGAGLSLIPGVGPIIGPIAGAAISNSG